MDLGDILGRDGREDTIELSTSSGSNGIFMNKGNVSISPFSHPLTDIYATLAYDLLNMLVSAASMPNLPADYRHKVENQLIPAHIRLMVEVSDIPTHEIQEWLSSPAEVNRRCLKITGYDTIEAYRLNLNFEAVIHMIEADIMDYNSAFVTSMNEARIKQGIDVPDDLIRRLESLMVEEDTEEDVILSDDLEDFLNSLLD